MLRKDDNSRQLVYYQVPVDSWGFSVILICYFSFHKGWPGNIYRPSYQDSSRVKGFYGSGSNARMEFGQSCKRYVDIVAM